MSGSASPPSPDSQKMATIYDVAMRANVSAKTVSKVINNLPDVSKATRAKVLMAIEELSYRPNLAARSLASQSSRMLALFSEAPAASCQYVASVQMALQSVCLDKGFHLVVEWMHVTNECVGQQVDALLAQSRLAAAILTPPLCDWPELIDAVKGAGTAVVRFSPGAPDPDCIDVDVDNRQAAYDMTGYLLSIGHRRIACVRGRPGIADAGKRFEGYCQALSDAGISVDEEICPAGNYTYNAGVRCGEALFQLKQRPTAIFASNDDMAAGVMAASHRYNLHVPRDISLAGFDDSVVANIISPRLTTCRQPVDQMVNAAITSLVHPSGLRPGRTVVPHKIIIRGTTAPPAIS